MAEQEKNLTAEQIEQLNKANEMRKTLGQPLLEVPNQPAPAAQPNSSTNPEVKDATESNPELTVEFQMAKLEEQRIELENRNKQLEEERASYEEKLKKFESEKRKAAGQPEPIELSYEDKRRIAEEVLGVSDLSELVKKSEIKTEPTEEEKQAAAQQRENEKIAYALQKGIFSKKELEDFISDSKNITELVYKQYYQQQKEADPELTDADIRSEFEDRYFLDKDENSRHYKRGQEELKLLANNLLNSRYGKIINFDNEYNQIEQSNLSQKQIQQKIQSEAPRYKKDVDAVYDSIKTIPITAKGKTYNVEVPAEILEANKQLMLANDYASEQIKNGWSKEVLRKIAETAIIQESLSLLVEKVADQYKFAF